MNEKEDMYVERDKDDDLKWWINKGYELGEVEMVNELEGLVMNEKDLLRKNKYRGMVN